MVEKSNRFDFRLTNPTRKKLQKNWKRYRKNSLKIQKNLKSYKENLSDMISLYYCIAKINLFEKLCSNSWYGCSSSNSWYGWFDDDNFSCIHVFSLHFLSKYPID